MLLHPLLVLDLHLIATADTDTASSDPHCCSQHVTIGPPPQAQDSLVPFSSVLPAQLALSLLSMPLVLIAAQYDSVDFLSTLSSFSLLFSRLTQTMDIDSVFRTFTMLFMLQITMLSGFILYCDCP